MKREKEQVDEIRSKEDEENKKIQQKEEAEVYSFVIFSPYFLLLFIKSILL